MTRAVVGCRAAVALRAGAPLSYAEYAAAGAPHYWVVDPDAPSVVVFARRGDRYAEVGRAAGEEPLELAEPFAVALAPAQLLGPLR